MENNAEAEAKAQAEAEEAARKAAEEAERQAEADRQAAAADTGTGTDTAFYRSGEWESEYGRLVKGRSRIYIHTRRRGASKSRRVWKRCTEALLRGEWVASCY